MIEEERIKLEKMKKLMEKEELIIDVNQNDFMEKVIEKSKEKPVIVDFWASWCKPCLVIGPILERIVKEYNGKVILARLNVTENQQLAAMYGVMSIPNVKMFKDGKVVDEFVGAIPEPLIRGWVERNLKKD
ncbi:thioredoxin [bacterium]|nr:thioredoxin [bacterium]